MTDTSPERWYSVNKVLYQWHGNIGRTIIFTFLYSSAFASTSFVGSGSSEYSFKSRLSTASLAFSRGSSSTAKASIVKTSSTGNGSPFILSVSADCSLGSSPVLSLVDGGSGLKERIRSYSSSKMVTSCFACSRSFAMRSGLLADSGATRALLVKGRVLWLTWSLNPSIYKKVNLSFFELEVEIYKPFVHWGL